MSTSAGFSPDSGRVGTIQDALLVLRRRKVVILVCVVLVPLFALVFSLRQQTLYQATARVLLSRQNLANEVSGVPDNLALTPDFPQIAATQAELAHTSPVARLAIQRVPPRMRVSPQELLASSSVSSNSNDDFLTFAVTAPASDKAQRLATALARSYVAYQLQVENAPLGAALAHLASQLAQLGSSKRVDPLRNELLAKQLQLRNLETLQTSTAYLAQPATSAAVVQPNTARNVGGGLAVGLILGIGLAMLWNAIDTTVRSGDEAGELLNLPILARLPGGSRAAGARGSASPEAYAASPAAESYRLLAVGTEFVARSHSHRVLAIVSGLEAEGKTTTTTELAAALANRGASVAVVDLDLRRPRVHEVFGLPLQPGITDCVLDPELREQAIHNLDQVGTSLGRLDVVPAGTLPPAPGDFVALEGLHRLVVSLREDHDYVLIDTAPMLRVSDTASLLRIADGAVVVARLGVARRRSLEEVRRTLAGLGVSAIGVAVTAADSDQAFVAGYGYYYREAGARSSAKIASR